MLTKLPRNRSDLGPKRELGYRDRGRKPVEHYFSSRSLMFLNQQGEPWSCRPM
jgi:hypothetical protein